MAKRNASMRKGGMRWQIVSTPSKPAASIMARCVQISSLRRSMTSARAPAKSTSSGMGSVEAVTV
jgi:hypothetical protein